MAYPLKKGFNIKAGYNEQPANYCMSTSETYSEYYGIGYIVSGDRKIETPERTFFVHKGYISPITIGLQHRTSSLSDTPYAKYGVGFTPYLAEKCIEHIGYEVFHNVMSNASYELPLEIQNLVTKLYEELVFEYQHYDKHSEFIMQGILEHIIITIMRHGILAESKEIKLSISDTAIIAVISYLDSHFMENPSVDKLAEIAKLSSSHFMKRFRDCVGSSYVTYLNTYKMKLAQSMLVNTNNSMQIISDELGFCNANYFCSTFKKIIKKTPSEYRNAIK